MTIPPEYISELENAAAKERTSTLVATIAMFSRMAERDEYAEASFQAIRRELDRRVPPLELPRAAPRHPPLVFPKHPPLFGVPPLAIDAPLVHTKTRVTVKREFSVDIRGADLIALLQKAGHTEMPANARVTVRTPSWVHGSEDVDIDDDCPILVSWFATEHTEV